MLTLLKLRRGQYSLVEQKVDPKAVAVGKHIRDLNLPSECVLTAIIREGQLIIPRGSTVLQPGDEVLAVVHALELNQLATLLRHEERDAAIAYKPFYPNQTTMHMPVTVIYSPIFCMWSTG